jgi:hypothetical protein
MRRLMFVPATMAALVVAHGAGAVGPSLPAIDGGSGITATNENVSYIARLAGSSTRIQERAHGRTVETTTIPGSWGIQLATLNGALSGLSPNGRVLVLTDNVQPTGSLRARSRFAVIDTRTLTVNTTITLHGDFSVDALSPQGEMLYLIHHISNADTTKYQVQAYNLQAGRLLPGVIADKSQAGWIMAGYPLTRITSRTGRFVYTLYRQDNNYPFVHALDTIKHTAICVGLPANWTTDQSWIGNAKMDLTGGTLAIKTSSGNTRFLLDTRTYELSTH